LGLLLRRTRSRPERVADVDAEGREAGEAGVGRTISHRA
jgi:hypothetical protein